MRLVKFDMHRKSNVLSLRIGARLIIVIALLTGVIASPAWALTQNEIQKLLASDGALGDDFGVSVAVDGDTAVIGARLDDDNGFDSGSAYVFTRSAGVWAEQQKLTASDGAANDLFGMRVAVDGDTAVIGAEADDVDGFDSGSAYVFTRSAGVWTEQQKLTASDAAEGDWFGSSVAVEGDTTIIGAERDDDNGINSGSAYVFTRSAGVWSEQQKLTASNGADFDDFGNSIAMDGDTTVIGARFGDVGNLFDDFGTAYVFTRSAGVWTEQQMLTASDGAWEDQFGVSVGVSADTVVIGAHLNGDNGAGSGSAYVFTRSAGVWTEQQKLTASDGAADHEFGVWVGVSGATAVIGAWQDVVDSDETGSAYVFTRSAGAWPEQEKLIASDAAAFDDFGQAVAVAGDTIVIGAPRDDDNGPVSGSAYVFSAPVPIFNDVPLDYWASSFIETLSANGITAGCGGGNYCPEDAVTRAQMAVFLERGIHGSSFTPPSATGIFDDCPVGYWAASWVEQFYADGITGGCSTNPPLYCPDDNVTRAQMAVFLLRSMYGSSYKPPSATGIFDDVPVTYWAAPWIEQLYAEGITGGCSSNPPLYCPDDTVTRAQMAVFIVRAFDL